MSHSQCIGKILQDDASARQKPVEQAKVHIQVEPDLRKLRNFLRDLTALLDRYWPEDDSEDTAKTKQQDGGTPHRDSASSPGDMGEADGSTGSPEELSDDYTGGSLNGCYIIIGA